MTNRHPFALFTVLAFGYAVLYLPIVSLIVYSFNASRLVTVWGGFSTKWYGELLRNEQLLAAAWLHDTLEDTDTTVEDLREAFGDDVANIVDRLTDQPGRNRRERQARTHARIREDPRAVRVKLADRIANVEAALEQKSNLRGMYRKEYPRFRQDLHRPGEFDAMWRDLDRLVKRRRRA